MTKDIREYFNVVAFGDDLRRFKEHQGITTLDLANLAGITPSILRDLMRDNSWHALSLVTFLKLCKAADLNVSRYITF